MKENVRYSWEEKHVKKSIIHSNKWTSLVLYAQAICVLFLLSFIKKKNEDGPHVPNGLAYRISLEE